MPTPRQISKLQREARGAADEANYFHVHEAIECVSEGTGVRCEQGRRRGACVRCSHAVAPRTAPPPPPYEYTPGEDGFGEEALISAKTQSVDDYLKPSAPPTATSAAGVPGAVPAPGSSGSSAGPTSLDHSLAQANSVIARHQVSS